ncbi:PAS domain S-box protein [Caenimonas sedimenti]|uniref:histidine kinase n=1 Tax=Caenimonas sedimenti TaxID=2596921 RepID=A0A562ZNV7_9BURK|nr:ATP-binding protein [Caenimonas sedimenti]TWO70087.1 PAS domain S-box protein [Caenimonas sedimenti]
MSDSGPPDLLAAWPGAGVSTQGFTANDVSHARLQAALTAGSAAAWHSNLQTRERWWAPAMFALHGLREGTDAPADYLSLVHPPDRPIVQQAFATSIATGSHKVQYRVVWPDGSVHWLEGIGRTTFDASGKPAEITGVCTLVDERKQEEADLRFMAQVSAELARSVDYEETLRRVAAMAVPHFADWCAVDMLDDAGNLRRLAVAHIDPQKVALAQELHRRWPPERNAPVGAWNVVRTGRPELLESIPDDLLELSARDEEHLRNARSLGLHSYMGVPLIGARGVLGVVTFVSAESARVYSQRDLELAGDLAARAAVAIQNSELVRALRASEARQSFLLRLTDELRRGGSTDAILEQVSRMLGNHFGVGRVGYGHVDEQLDVIDYDVCWTANGVPPLLGRFPASAFGPQVIARLRAGDTIAIENVREDALTNEATTVRTSHEVDTRAILVVPLFKAGRLRTIVYLNQREARRWSPVEIGLMNEVAERTRELIERGRAEEALRASESRWRGLFEQMAEGFFVAEAIRDPLGVMHDFVFLQVNPAFERLTGISPAEAVGKTLTQAIPGAPRDLVETYARVLATGEPAEFELHVPALNNRWYEARAQRIGAERFSVLFLEVTERKHAQRQLAHAAQRYRTLFQSIDEGFCILEVLFDGQGRPCDYRFIEANPAFERQSGLAGAVGRTIREVVPDIEEAYIETYARVAMTGEPIRFQSHSKSMGRWFDTFALRIGDQHLQQVALLFTDITDRKRAQDALAQREAQLREVDTRKDEFLATLAHELRNPLAPVRNAVEILKRDPEQPDRVRWATGLLDRQATALSRLIDDLMDVSRINRGRIELRPEALSIREVLADAIESVRPAADASRHELVAHLPDASLTVEADRTRLTQAFVNLLNNAVKYTEDGGRIDVSVKREQNEALVRFADTGIGIAADHLEKVFEMFSQAESALSRSRGGLGIGLSLTQRLIQMHGGTISASSPGPGQGSEFEVRLPLSAGPIPPVQGLAGVQPRQRTLRVLVADDNTDAASTMGMLLEMLGHHVKLVFDGRTAVRETPAFDPELVILDIGMPHLNGYEAARQIRAQPGGPQRMMVALTGWGQQQDLLRSRDAGFDRHVVKPIEVDALRNLLSSIPLR